jgi:hypothetical protein
VLRRSIVEGDSSDWLLSNVPSMSLTNNVLSFINALSLMFTKLLSKRNQNCFSREIKIAFQEKSSELFSHPFVASISLNWQAEC